MKVSTQLGLGFALLALLGLLQTGFGWWNLHNMASDMRLLTDDRMAKIELFSEVVNRVNVVARSTSTLVRVTEPAQRQAARQAIDDARSKADGLLKDAAAMTRSDEAKALLKAVEDARAPFRASTNKVIELALANKGEEATALFSKELHPLQDAYLKALDNAVTYQQSEAKTTGTQAQASATLAGWLMLLAGLVSVAIGAAAAWFISRRLTRQLGGEPADVVRIANAVAEGHLDVDVHARAGDTDSIVAAMERMRDNLAHIVGQVRNSSDSIATGSAQIATGNADLSQRTEEQASNLQQTAASMEELSGTVRTSADTASQANALAAQAAAAATRGGETVGTVVATMQDIAASSRKIADIIGVIDGIAFQTNILALNAAVEAARAGEQGRGFAVVASEVRSLAGRSADAAKEIKALIGASVDRVEVGARQVNEAGTAMQDIVAQVQRVNQLINEIAHATGEQTTGISQVGDAVTQLDQVTQQNAALVEESAAAAESLKQQAAHLAQVVSVFRMAGGAGPGQGALATPAKAYAPAASTYRRPAAPAARPASVAPVVSAAPVAASAGADNWESF